MRLKANKKLKTQTQAQTQVQAQPQIVTPTNRVQPKVTTQTQPTVNTPTQPTIAHVNHSTTINSKVPDKAISTDAKGRTIYEGPRGGRYYIDKNGKKEYLPKDKQ